MDFIKFLAEYIDRTLYYVDYKTPELIILIEICNDLLCVSVLDDYIENKSYNLFTLIEENKNKTITNKNESDCYFKDVVEIENTNENFMIKKGLDKQNCLLEEENSNSCKRELNISKIVEANYDNSSDEELDII